MYASPVWYGTNRTNYDKLHIPTITLTNFTRSFHLWQKYILTWDRNRRTGPIKCFICLLYFLYWQNDANKQTHQRETSYINWISMMDLQNDIRPRKLKLSSMITKLQVSTKKKLFPKYIPQRGVLSRICCRKMKFGIMII